jgi:hypothetical protein
MESLDIKRIGEPEPNDRNDPLLRIGQNVYRITTTPLPAAGPRGKNWLEYFNNQLQAPPIVGWHSGGEITVYCNPDDCPDWLAIVDGAIKTANEKEGAIQYEGNV